MPDILRVCFHCTRLFTATSLKARSFQCSVLILSLLFSYFVISHNVFVNVRFKISSLMNSNSSGEFNVYEFRKFMAESSQKINNATSAKSALCPIVPPGLVGAVAINKNILSYNSIISMNNELLPGGAYSPTVCSSRHHVAILVPYRDRQAHLKLFLQNIHPFLRKQQIDYRIFVIELASNIRFNRAMLFNIGYVEAMKLKRYNCFIFHDVDLIPENDFNLYTCSEKPRHMSVAIDKMKYKLPYPQIFGGVSALTKEQFETVNGFSNSFFGWGGEDDDMYNRIAAKKMNIIRYSAEVARYKMMSHAKETPNPVRGSLLKAGQERFAYDGLNSMHYKVLKFSERKLYTWILVSIDEKAVKDAIEQKKKLESS